MKHSAQLLFFLLPDSIMKDSVDRRRSTAWLMTVRICCDWLCPYVVHAGAAHRMTKEVGPLNTFTIHCRSARRRARCVSPQPLTLGVGLVVTQQRKLRMPPDHRYPQHSGGEGSSYSGSQLRTTSKTAQTLPAKHNISHHCCRCLCWPRRQVTVCVNQCPADWHLLTHSCIDAFVFRYFLCSLFKHSFWRAQHQLLSK